jgi:hypothetical protein
MLLPEIRADEIWIEGRGPFKTLDEAYAAQRLVVCPECRGLLGQHFPWCKRNSAEPLEEPRSDLNATEGPWSGGFADNH